MDRASDPSLDRSAARRDRAICIALGALVCVVFFRVAGHQFVTFDDPEYVYGNALVVRGLTPQGIRWAFTTLTMGHWHPLTWLSLMADVSLFGLRPGAFAITSMLLHLGATIFLFLGLRSLTRDPWPAAMVAALFAVHPISVEPVAWIADRKDAVSGFFGCAALLAYARWIERPGASRYWTVVGLFALSLLGKAMLMTLPVVLLLVDFWPLHRWSRADRWRLVREKVPMLVIAIPVALLARRAQSVAGAMSGTGALPVPLRLENAVLSYARYLGQLLWPLRLSFFYPYRPYPSTVAVVGALVLIGLVSTAALRYSRSAPWLFTGWLWFVVTLAPVIGLFQSGLQLMADRYAYLPSVGVFIALVWGARAGAARWSVPRPVLAATAAAILIVLGRLSFAQNATWQDSFALFTHATEVTSDNSLAHYQLAALYDERGQQADKRAHLRATVAAVRRTHRIGDDRLTTPRTFPPWYLPAEVALGGDLIEEAQARFDAHQADQARTALGQGTELLEEALRISPTSAEICGTLSWAYMLAGRSDHATELRRQALALANSYSEHLNLGAVMSRQGRMGEALGEYRRAAALAADSVEPLVYLGLGLLQTGDTVAALEDLRLALRRDPEASNAFLTHALALPPRATNLDEFLAGLARRD